MRSSRRAVGAALFGATAVSVFRNFLIDTINGLQKSPYWSSTAGIAYDDSDGWYDHQMGPMSINRRMSSMTLSTPPAAERVSRTAREPAQA